MDHTQADTMKIDKTKINDCVVIETEKYDDRRGFLQELYSRDWEHPCLQTDWKHVVSSKSKNGVIRGIHWAPYNKLVSCVAGKLFDVIVDMRPESTTFRLWVGVWLNGNSTKKVFVPKGCGHGFFAATCSVMVYLKDQCFRPDVEQDWHWQSFGIEWPECPKYILSDKDQNAKTFSAKNFPNQST